MTEKLKSEGHWTLHIKGHKNIEVSLGILSSHAKQSAPVYQCVKVTQALQQAGITCLVKSGVLAAILKWKLGHP